jgi:hypothetical protein
MPTLSNFAIATIVTAPSPATSGLSLVLASGKGALFPDAPFDAIVWPTGVAPSAANAEIIRVYERSGDTFAQILRATQNTTARTIVVGDQIMVTPLERLIDDGDLFQDTRNRYVIWKGALGSATLNVPVGLSLLSGGLSVARSATTASWRTREFRQGFQTSTTAGQVAFLRYGGGYITTGGTGVGGFHFKIRFQIIDPATVTGARMFVGVSTTITAPTNVEPSTLVQCAGIGHGASDTNMKIFWGGATAQAPVDLGASFPISGANGGIYELELFSFKGSTAIYYRVRYYTTDPLIPTATASGTLAAANTPNSTALLCAPWSYRTNNATALVCGYDVTSFMVDGDPS